jgi:small subunit ribosomal protein S17
VAEEEQNQEETTEEPQAEEAAAEQAAPEAQATEEAPADEAPAEEAAPQPAAEAKKKRKIMPRSQRHTHSKPKRERPAERKPITRTPKPQAERGRRQERRGVVVSSAMDKTIVVKVDTIKAHPRYKKVVRRSVKFHAHDEQNSANVGDVVRIVETRPLSKSKHWKLVEVVEAAR